MNWKCRWLIRELTITIIRLKIETIYFRGDAKTISFQSSKWKFLRFWIFFLVIYFNHVCSERFNQSHKMFMWITGLFQYAIYYCNFCFWRVRWKEMKVSSARGRTIFPEEMRISSSDNFIPMQIVCQLFSNYALLRGFYSHNSSLILIELRTFYHFTLPVHLDAQRAYYFK